MNNNASEPDIGLAIDLSPQVSDTSPDAGEKRVDIGARIRATFDKPVSLSSVDSTQFTLWLEDEIVPANVTFDGTIAVLHPDDDLLASSRYEASLNAGIIDIDGNALEPYQWYFYTDGSGWGTPEQLNDSVESSDAPQISVNSAGNAVAVWRQYDGSRDSIYSGSFTTGVGWGSATLLENGSDGNAYPPQVSVNSDGNAVAVWTQSDGSRDNIYANRFSASDGVWEGVELLEDNSGRASRPQVSVDADGNALVVWVQDDGPYNSIYYNRFTAITQSWDGAQLLESNSAGDAATPQISFDDSGNAIAVWTQDDGSRINVSSNRYSAISKTWGTEQVIDDVSTNTALAPQISVDGTGNAFVVWSLSDGFSSRVYSNQYMADLEQWGDVTALDADTTHTSQVPQISTHENGSALAVWMQPASSTDSIYANIYTDGSWGTAALLENDDSGLAFSPVVSIDADGNGLAVWRQTDGTRFNIYSSRYSSITGEWSTPELLETNDAGTASDPQFGIDANGNAHAVWVQFDGSVDNIYSNHFDARVVAP